MKNLLSIAIFTITFLQWGCEESSRPTSLFDPLTYVDPFIGTGAHGHTFPGPTTPFGAVQLSPDTRLLGWEASSGYHYSDSIIYGFSHTHLSGTGIGDLGDVLFLPYTGPQLDSLAARYDKNDEKAEVGLYEVDFKDFDVKTELTTSPRAGFHRYTFSSEAPKLLIDLGHILQANWGHQSTGAQLEIIDNQTIRGRKSSSGWAFDHQVYFFARFSAPFEVVKVIDGANELKAPPFQGTQLKTHLSFDEETVLVKVGISPVDVEGAQKNVDHEVPNWDFDQVVAENKRLWREALRNIQVSSEQEEVMTNFYTAFYHSQMAPMLYQDVDGRYRGMDKSIHHAAEGFTNYTVFSLWDIFRSWTPLMSIINRKKSADWIESLMKKSEDGGILPKWPLAANYTGTMVGYPSAALFADALNKGIIDEDPGDMLEALQFASSYQPDLNITEPRAENVAPKHLKFIDTHGFIPRDSISGSVSYGLECAYYDWCISLIAEQAGDEELARKYRDRSTYFQNYFNPASGFMEGKQGDGSWLENFSPSQSNFHGDFIEGNSWQWSWSVFHDIQGLIKLMGGPAAFEKKLDTLFTTSSEMEGEVIPGDLTGLIGQYAHGNEPSHHVAYLYNYISKPNKAQEQIDFILQNFYLPTPEGIVGNEDCGQMSAWYMMSAMGIYQVCPGDNTFTLGRPLLDQVQIRLENGNVFHIETINNSPVNMYVNEVQLNGKTLSEPFIEYDDILNGGSLTFHMTDQPKP